jgi:metal-sulfur cluster biosynthetic enzyme
MSDKTTATITADRAGRSAADLDVESGIPASTPATVEQETGSAASDTASLDDIEEALRDVIDPELGINVVDLGLIYDLQVDDSNVCLIDMTLTSAACPLQEMIEDQVCAALTGGSVPVVSDYRINWVWMPPWGPEKITDDGREQLRAIGFNI